MAAHARVPTCHPIAAAGVTARHPGADAGVTEAHPRDLTAHFEAALRRLNIPRKQVETWWSCSESLVRQVFTGEKPLTDDKIALLPKFVQRVMHDEWGADLDQLTGSRAAAAEAIIALARIVGFRMAKAEINDQAADEPKAGVR